MYFMFGFVISPGLIRCTISSDLLFSRFHRCTISSDLLFRQVSDVLYVRICYFSRSHQMYYMFGFVISPGLIRCTISSDLLFLQVSLDVLYVRICYFRQVSSDVLYVRICYFSRSHQMYYMFGFVISPGLIRCAICSDLLFRQVSSDVLYVWISVSRLHHFGCNLFRDNDSTLLLSSLC